MTTSEISEFEPGMFSVMLEPCSALVLPRVLLPEVPFVYVESHWPNPRYEWWDATVPLKRGGRAVNLKVRRLEFDISLTTAQFLSLVEEFADAGLTVLQLDRALPNGLVPNQLKPAERYRVLVANGLQLEFSLPHAIEYAQTVSSHRHVLERILRDPVVASGRLP